MKTKFFFLFILNIFFISNFYSQSTSLNSKNFPKIQELSSKNIIFKQLLQTIEYNEKNLSAKKEEFFVEFYTYNAKKNDTLFSIHASTGIPYDTIATLNKISGISENLQGKTLIIPAVKGIFIAQEPKTTLEILLSTEYSNYMEKNSVSYYIIDNTNFCFLPNQRLSPTQRAFFLDTSLKLPLENIKVTSEFGYRTSPIYGKWKFHKGIDFAASEGTQTFACKAGTVTTCIKNDKIFGNYIIISHADGMTSVYAHLSKVFVKKGDWVSKGSVIALTGKSGAVTGPHLHFEIRQNGVAEDPAELLTY